MKIEKGKKFLPPRIVLYGVEGVGKTTFGSMFPDPIFICAEAGADQFDVTRIKLEGPEDLEELWKYLSMNLDSWKTLVIDTIDWFEAIVGKGIADQFGVDIIENIKWNKGGTFLQREIKKILEGPLDFFKSKGKFVVLLGHAEVESFTDPNLLESYDRYSLKSHKKTKAIIREWCDCLLFTDFEKDVVGGKARATGKRVVWANHSPSSDAKNRFQIPDGIELKYNNFTSYFNNTKEKK